MAGERCPPAWGRWGGFAIALLGACLTSTVSADSAYKGFDGVALLRMCQGADKVRALSVMCHNYLNGYLDAAYHFNKHPAFCLAEGDKEKLPNSLVGWLNERPERQKQPAGAVLEQVLKASFACKGKG